MAGRSVNLFWLMSGNIPKNCDPFNREIGSARVRAVTYDPAPGSRRGPLGLSLVGALLAKTQRLVGTQAFFECVGG